MTLLALFAHPDDEAFGTGGTLARYAAEGHDVYLICATRGESGKLTDPEIDAASDVGALREEELKAACEALCIHPPIFLGFHDSGRQERVRRDDPKALMNVDEEGLEKALLPHVVRLAPEVMITFDPHGVYGHIDHVKMHRAASATFWSSGNVMPNPPKRLFYTAVPTERFRAMQALREGSPLSGLDADLYGLSEGSFAAVLDVEAFAEQKQRAVRAHRSQVGPNSSFAAVPEVMWREMFVKETFTLGGLRGSFPEMPVDDLFVGLKTGEARASRHSRVDGNDR